MNLRRTLLTSTAALFTAAMLSSCGSDDSADNASATTTTVASSTAAPDQPTTTVRAGSTTAVKPTTKPPTPTAKPGVPAPPGDYFEANGAYRVFELSVMIAGQKMAWTNEKDGSYFRGNGQHFEMSLDPRDQVLVHMHNDGPSTVQVGELPKLLAENSIQRVFKVEGGFTSPSGLTGYNSIK